MTSARDALSRLVAALDAWEEDCASPKVDLSWSRALDAELDEAREVARAVLLGLGGPP